MEADIMKNIIIAGTGGFAAELTQYIKDNQNKLENFEYKIKDTWRRMHVIPP